MKIYLDFDGTVVEHYFPEIGAENPHAIQVIARLQAAGHDIVLNTYRADIDQKHVQEALDHIHSFEEIKQPIEKFLPQKLEPRSFDLDLAKESNQLYIDDISTGIPMRRNIVLEHGMMVDWVELEKKLEEAGILESAERNNN
jgi:phage tail sheath gpL-like